MASALANIDRRTHQFTREANGWWRAENGTVVGHVKWMLTEGVMFICDVEVREGWRGQGIARQMIQAVEVLEGETMFSSGSYTPLGYAALARGAKLAPGCEASIRHRDMTFVQDWDAMTPKFPL